MTVPPLFTPHRRCLKSAYHYRPKPSHQDRRRAPCRSRPRACAWGNVLGNRRARTRRGCPGRREGTRRCWSGCACERGWWQPHRCSKGDRVLLSSELGEGAVAAAHRDPDDVERSGVHCASFHFLSCRAPADGLDG